MADRVKFNRIAPTFVVADVVKTAEYYRDVLGFEIYGYFLDPPVYAMVGRDQAEIHFGKPDGSDTSESVFSLREIGCDVYIWVSDVHAMYDELEESGANILEGPIKRIYESTEVVVSDCNGLRLVFAD